MASRGNSALRPGGGYGTITKKRSAGGRRTWEASMNGLFEIILGIVVEGEVMANGASRRASWPVRIALSLFVAALAAVALAAAVLLILVGTDSGTAWMCILGLVLLVCFFLGCFIRVRDVRAKYRAILAARALESGETEKTDAP